MLTHPTIDTLKALKLHGMLGALEEQQRDPAAQRRAAFDGPHGGDSLLRGRRQA